MRGATNSWDSLRHRLLRRVKCRSKRMKVTGGLRRRLLYQLVSRIVEGRKQYLSGIRRPVSGQPACSALPDYEPVTAAWSRKGQDNAHIRILRLRWRL